MRDDDVDTQRREGDNSTGRQGGTQRQQMGRKLVMGVPENALPPAGASAVARSCSTSCLRPAACRTS